MNFKTGNSFNNLSPSRQLIQLNDYVKYILLLQLISTVQVLVLANILHVTGGTTTAEIIGDDVFFEIVEPTELEYTYRLRPARDFGAPFNASFSLKKIALVPMEPMHGCVLPTNSNDLKGNVALVERGMCSFKTKTIKAEEVGCKAVIITDLDISSDEYFIQMIDDDTKSEAHIPAGFLLGKNGFVIQKTLKKLNRKFAVINIPVNLTFTPVRKIKQPPWLGW